MTRACFVSAFAIVFVSLAACYDFERPNDNINHQCYWDTHNTGLTSARLNLVHTEPRVCPVDLNSQGQVLATGATVFEASATCPESAQGSCFPGQAYMADLRVFDSYDYREPIWSGSGSLGGTVGLRFQYAPDPENPNGPTWVWQARPYTMYNSHSSYDYAEFITYTWDTDSDITRRPTAVYTISYTRF